MRHWPGNRRRGARARGGCLAALLFALVVPLPGAAWPTEGAAWGRAGEAAWGGVAAVLAASAAVWIFVLRRRLAAARRASEAKYRELVELAVDGILVGTPDGVVCDANRSICRVLGRDLADIVGRHIGELFPAETLAENPLRFDLLDAGEILTRERALRRPDGTRIWVEMRSRRMPGGGYQSFVRDVTERRRMESELVDRTAELEHFFTAALELLCIADAEGRFVRVNQEWERVLGYRAEEVVGMRFLDFVHPDDMEATLGAIRDLNSRRTVQNFVNRYRGRNGEYRTMEWRSVAREHLVYAAARDITERMRTEEALRHSEATYREIFNAVNDVIYIHDTGSGRILDVNDRVLDLLGYAPDEARNMDMVDISSGAAPYTQEGAAERMARAAAGEPQVFEWHFRHRDGHLFWAEVSLRRGVIVGQDRVLAIVRDITEKKRARESLERTQFAMDRAQDGILWVDGDGRLVYVNDSVCQSLERSREELLAMRIFEVDPDFPESGWEQHKADLRRLGHMSFEGRHVAKSGRIFPVEVSSNFFEFQGQWLACAFDRDISERRQREEELAQSRRMLRDVLDTIPVRVFWKDLEGRYVGCNQAFARDVGRPDPESVVGEDDFDLVHNEFAESYRADDLSVLAQGQPRIGYEAPLTFPDGRIAWARISKVPLRDGEGTICGLLGVYEDITHRRQAETLLGAKNRELEQIVYVASHDLRSPLVNIDGYGRELGYSVETIRTALDGARDALGKVPAALPGMDDALHHVRHSVRQMDILLKGLLPDMDDALHHIRHSTRQMDALLKGLLKVSRTGRMALSIGEVDMNAVLATVVTNLEFQVKSRNVDLRVGDLPPCLGDAAQLVQVFSNLLGNAIKYLDPKRPGLVSVSGFADLDTCSYCIEDNGIGIAPEHQEAIFELFHRLDPRGTEGEGLGLTIVRQILGRMGGEVRVESQPGVGSRFHVALPGSPTA